MMLDTLTPGSATERGWLTEAGRPATQHTTVEPSLLGVDVGFAKDARSTGLAWRVNGVIGACRTGSAWSARSLSLPAGVTFDLAALDAPLVPAGPGIPIRGCEAAFYRGAFWNRCRPGMSHHGRGLELRRAGEIASAQFTAVLHGKEISAGAAVPGVPVVEAFPNTFLGVLLPERVYAPCTKIKGAKSDWLYQACVAEGVFVRLVEALGWPLAPTVDRLASERNHDIRAALICLLTAGFASAGTAAVVGDAQGGWFWLPPVDLWADWAVAAIKENVGHVCRRGRPDLTLLALQGGANQTGR
jgi:hypothetical protein